MVSSGDVVTVSTVRKSPVAGHGADPRYAATRPRTSSAPGPASRSRVPDPDDGRARLVRLTARGREIVPVARAEERRIDAQWEAHLGAERMGQLRAALAELRDLVDP